MSKSSILIKKLGKQAANDMICGSEDNDCVVRAVQHAFGVDYIDAHHFCETKLHRISGNGTYTGRYLHLIKQAFNTKIKMLGTKRGVSGYRNLSRPVKSKKDVWSNAKQKYVTKRIIKQQPYKVKDFVKANPLGSFIITVAKHAFALVDGEIIGNWNDDKAINKRVTAAYKVG